MPLVSCTCCYYLLSCLRESRLQVQLPFVASLCRVCTLSPWLHGFSLVSTQSPTTWTLGWWKLLIAPSMCVCLWWPLQGVFLPFSRRVKARASTISRVDANIFNRDPVLFCFLLFYRAATSWRTRTWRRSGSLMPVTERKFCMQHVRYPR